MHLATDLPTTGKAPPELAPCDAWMTDFLVKNQVPGGSLAIAREGKVVYARGFGYADREDRAPVQPEALFRIASISKPVTAVAILKLVQDEKLKLEDKVFDLLTVEPFFEKPDGRLDERWKQITVVECLCHTGGWDRAQSYDPMFQAIRMAKAMGQGLPILPEHVIRFQLGQPLDFDPLTRYAYSNFGYCVLGRVIEKVTGQPYEKYVQESILKPLGITTAQIGGSLESERAEGEVKYYVAGDETEIAVVGPGAGTEKVPVAYGAWRQETLDAHGGWIASAVDLVKFAAAFDLVDGGRKSRGGFLKAANVRLMFSPQATIVRGELNGQGSVFYGLGWNLREEEGLLVARHGGSLPCTASSLMHFPDGLNVAVLFNIGRTGDNKPLGGLIEGPLTELVRGIEKWPG
ncbi:MAG: serine hydrolase domain-containing protein [Pirellulaceae bacterium]|nr:serine hydrolase domain-containing protein [Pirellulaceae bacterium]